MKGLRYQYQIQILAHIITFYSQGFTSLVISRYAHKALMQFIEESNLNQDQRHRIRQFVHMIFTNQLLQPYP